MVSKQPARDPLRSLLLHKDFLPCDMKSGKVSSEIPPQDTPIRSQLPTPLPSSSCRQTFAQYLSEIELKPRFPKDSKPEQDQAYPYPMPRLATSILEARGFSRQFEEIEKTKRQHCHPDPSPTTPLKGKTTGRSLQLNKNSTQDHASPDTTPMPQVSQNAFSRQFEEIEDTERHQVSSSSSSSMAEFVEAFTHRRMHGQPCNLGGCQFSRDFNRSWGPGSRDSKIVSSTLAQTMRTVWATQRKLLLERMDQDPKLPYPQTRTKLQTIIKLLDLGFTDLTEHTRCSTVMTIWCSLHLLGQWRLEDMRGQVEDMHETLVSSAMVHS